MHIGIIKLYFIGRTTFKCHQKGQNLENKSRYIQLLLLLLLLLRIRRPFSDPKEVVQGLKNSLSWWQMVWAFFLCKLELCTSKTVHFRGQNWGPVWFAYGASLLRRRRRLRPFGPSWRLTEALKFCEMARAFRKGKVGLSSSKTLHFRGQNWGPNKFELKYKQYIPTYFLVSFFSKIKIDWWHATNMNQGLSMQVLVLQFVYLVHCIIL